jgi:hypothetical protein
MVDIPAMEVDPQRASGNGRGILSRGSGEFDGAFRVVHCCNFVA